MRRGSLNPSKQIPTLASRLENPTIWFQQAVDTPGTQNREIDPQTGWSWARIAERNWRWGTAAPSSSDCGCFFGSQKQICPVRRFGFFGNVLQGMIHEIVNDQTWELQESYFTKYFPNHVRAIWLIVPIVRFAPTQSRLSGSISIPLEIMTKIFDCCDNESSVALYHVNSEWYTTFKQQPDTLWRAKMLKLNPWI